MAIRVDTTLYHLHHSFSFPVQRNPSPCLYSSKLQARPSSSPTSLLLPLLRSPSPSRFFISRPLLSPSASLQSLFFSIYNNTICFIASHLFSSSKSACCDFCKLAAAVPSLGCITTVFILCLVPSIAAAPLIGIIFIDDIISSPVHSLRPLIIIISLLSSSFFFLSIITYLLSAPSFTFFLSVLLLRCLAISAVALVLQSLPWTPSAPPFLPPAHLSHCRSPRGDSSFLLPAAQLPPPPESSLYRELLLLIDGCLVSSGEFQSSSFDFSGELSNFRP